MLAGLLFAIKLIEILIASPYSISAFFGGAVIIALLWIMLMKPLHLAPGAVPKVHFPGLNGLRFLAAFMVVLYHIEQIKGIYGFQGLSQSKFWEPCIVRLGGLGVTFFFVLSGFLITYLLLTEHHHTKTIHLKDFYIRRALRIWPVYFLLTGLSFFVFPSIGILHIPNMSPIIDANYWPKFALYAVLSVHVAYICYPGVLFGNALWSTSVEEHFYFFWPLMIRALKGRIMLALCAIVIGLIVLKQLAPIWYFRINHHASMKTLLNMDVVARYFQLFRIDCMAIGGLGALLFHKKSRVLNFLYHRVTQAIMLPVAVYCVVKGIRFEVLNWSYGGVVDDDVYSLLFLFIILNVATNPRSLLKLENQVCDFLGKISYGLYAYNWIAVIITVNFMLMFGSIRNVYLRNLYIYTVSFGLLIIFASASYYLMERVFLRMKVNYGSVSAGNMPNSAFPDVNSEEIAKCI